MKKYLPYIEATDPLLLSNILLEQSTIGASPNVKLLDYLKYAVYSQMTTFSAVMQNIVTYKDVSQPYCLSALVGFLSKIYNYPFEKFRREYLHTRISYPDSSSGSPEEPMDLSKSLVLLKVWLFEVTLKALQRLNESKGPPEIVEDLLKACSQLLGRMMKHDVCNGLFCLSLSEADPDPSQPPSSTSSSSSLPHQKTYAHRLECLSGEIGRLLCQPFSQSIGDETRQALVFGTKFDGSVASGHTVTPSRLIESNDQFVNLTTNVLVVMETYLFPCNDMQVLAEKLVTLERLLGMQRPQLYSEIIRSCYLGLLDDDIKPEDIKWSTFIYIRLPFLFSKLLQSSSADDKQLELSQGVEQLLDVSFLLDAVDTKCNSDCLQFLVNEFLRHSLLTEAQVKRITNKRQLTSMRTKTHENSSLQPKEPASLTLKAEPTLITILKISQSVDSLKSPEMNLKVMNPLIIGKSFELVSSVAAATGKLQILVVRLIRINEMSKIPVAGEMVKNSQTRATVFDISFLLLCHVVQIYGLEVISSCTECRSTFFYQWATKYLPDGEKIQSAESNLPTDLGKMEQLFEQFGSDSEFKPSVMRLDDACTIVPQVILELLKAWKQNAVDQEFVRSILDTLKSSMCCLAVAASTWLCNNISCGGPNESLQMERFMLQQLCNYFAASETGNNTNNYVERSYMARHFIGFLVSRVELQSAVAPEGARTIYSLPHDALNSIECRRERLMEIFREVHSSGCLKIKKLLMLERIYEMSACLWFAQNIVEAMFSYVVLEDITKAVCLAHSLFHMDLEELTACLVEVVIPALLLTPESHSKYLSEPYSSATVKLAVLNLATICKLKQINRDPECKVAKRKRKRSEYLAENPDDSSTTDLEKPFKQKRDNENGEGSSIPTSNNFLLGDMLCTQESYNNANPPSTNSNNTPSRDHLTKPLTNLLSLFHGILQDSNTGPQTDFVLKFVRELLGTGTTTARYILQNSPQNFPQLVSKFIHKELRMEHMFAFGDVNTPSGKAVVAKAICQAVKQKSAESSSSSHAYA